MNPVPGEVWICVDKHYRTGDREQYIYSIEDGPLLITYIDASHIGTIQASNDNGKHWAEHPIRRGVFEWDKQFARIWPPPPGWPELLKPEVRSLTEHVEEDLRRHAT